MSENQTHQQGQLSQLPALTHYITGHDKQGNSIIQHERPAKWRSFVENQIFQHEIYATTGFPINLSNDADIAESDRALGTPDLGMIHDSGVICRIVDFAPQSPAFMHQTQSLDYGVVLEGTVEMMMDSGHVRILRRGEVAVQRATMHGWRNPSETEWTRMFFVMQSTPSPSIDAVA